MTVTKSRHNIFGQLTDSDEYYIINPLSGEADILDSETAREYLDDEFSDPDEWLEKGYLIRSVDEEEQRFRNGYMDFFGEA
jgi:uncharacterized protein